MSFRSALEGVVLTSTGIAVFISYRLFSSAERTIVSNLLSLVNRVQIPPSTNNTINTVKHPSLSFSLALQGADFLSS